MNSPPLRLTSFARWVFAFCCVVGAASSTAAGDERDDFFENNVRPLLAERCVKCHGAEKQSGGLRLDSADGLQKGGDSGQAVVAGNADESLLLAAVRYGDDLQMPPDARLKDAEVNMLAHWIATGAHWPPAATVQSSASDPASRHWAFQPVQSPTPPTLETSDAAEKAFLRNPIDAFVLRRLQQANLTHSPEADRRTLIRRVTYTLTGLPPTPDEVEAFVADTGADAYDRLVERLLDSPAYGEQWARHWLDVARYSDSKGYVYAREERFWVHAWTYRDWVVNAFNSDMPYDRFLLLQIAADQAPDRRDIDLAAMGFLTLGRRFLGVQRDIIDDRIDVVTRGTMSLTVGCARCHDHKYDPIPTADYYSLYGVFASSRERITQLSPPDRASESMREFQQELAARQAKLDALLQERRASTSDRVRSRVGDYLRAQFELEKYPEEGFDQVIATSDLLPSFVRRWQDHLRRAQQNDDRVFSLWRAYLPDSPSALGDHPAPPTSVMNPLVAAAFSTPPESREELIQRYAELFAKIDQQWKDSLEEAEQAQQDAPTALTDPAAEELRQVLYGPGSPCVVPDEPVVHTEYDFDSATCNELWKLQGEVDRWIINSPAPAPFAVILEDRERPMTPRIFRRGNPAQKGEEVPRQFLQLMDGEDRQPFQQGSGRWELAQRIIDPGNPLTARVMVNRVWAHHFGAGLVATPGDFGTRAAAPSHPELLDWLATQLIADGWSLKALHRRIVCSGVFRQSSAGPANPERLARARQMDPANRMLWRMNSHRLSFEEMRDSMLQASAQLDHAVGGKPASLFNEPFPRRRTLYGTVDRQFLPSALRVFDFANPDLHTPQRSATTVPQQALFLMNHPLALQQARALADQVQDAGNAEAIVTALYRRVLQRRPSEQQLREASAYLQTALAPEAQKPPETSAQWSYGFGALDETQGRVASFTPLPHFTGSAWQGGAAWPDAKLGWVQLTATGGHPGNDRDHACIRRWTAPNAMTVSVNSQVRHEAKPGDGVRAFLVSSSKGVLRSATVHEQTADLNVETLEVEAGETLDFLCDIGDVLNSDQHLWRAAIMAEDGQGSPTAWNSESDFTHDTTQLLTPIEQLAQVLLCSNEFLFVD